MIAISSDKTKVLTLSSLITLLFAPIILQLINVWWTREDYSHGFFVIPLAFYMFWVKRRELLTLTSSPLWIGLPILFLGILSYSISFTVKFHILTNISIIIIILGLLLLFLGWSPTKIVLFPVLFLLFMFPIPEAYYILITNPLKMIVTRISVQLIYLFGIPVYVEGNLLFLSNTQLAVTEACSGIRSLYSYLMLGCIFALISKRLRTRIILIVSTIFLAIMINVFRVTITGILASYVGANASEGFFHEFSGIVLFAVGLVIFFLEYMILEKKSVKSG